MSPLPVRPFAPGPFAGFPDASWPTGAPEDHGVDGAQLAKIPAEFIRHSTVIRGGVEIFTTGEPDRRMGWASCARPFVTTAYLSAIYDGLIARAFVDSPIKKVFPKSAAAQLFADDVHGCHLLSYTSGGSPAGSKWRYSGGADPRGDANSTRKHWPRMHVLFREVVSLDVWDYLNRFVFSKLGGALSADGQSTEDGTTLRVSGSPRDMARAGYLWLQGGRWRDRQLIDERLMTRATAGGPLGDGQPYEVEGWQFHLVKGGRAWEEPRELKLPGVPDGTFMARDGGENRGLSHGSIVVVPAMELVIAYRGARAVDAFLPRLCRAVTA
jgi:CubicO group peptidase (beta-lactamase class C family)